MWPFIQLIERYPGKYPAEALLDSLSESSLRIRQPDTGSVIEWTDEGDRVVTSSDDLIRRLTYGERTTFEVWLPSGIGVPVSFRTLEDSVYSLAFDLKALQANEIAVIKDHTVARFMALAEAGSAVLLVVDGRGDTSDFDWWDFLHRHTLPPSLPQIVGLDAARLEDLRRWVGSRRYEHVGGCVLLYEE